MRVSVSVAERLVAAARQAPLLPEAPVARHVLAADLGLLADLDAQVGDADARIATLIPATPCAELAFYLSLRANAEPSEIPGTRATAAEPNAPRLTRWPVRGRGR